MRVLVDVGAAIVIGAVQPGTSIGLPIPASVPANVSVFFQTFHLDNGAPGGIAASNGQRISAIQ